MTEPDLTERVRAFLAEHPHQSMDRLEFLRARFDAGLAWVHFPVGLGGLAAPRALQAVVDAEFAAAGAPDNNPRRLVIGLGMAAPTLLRHGTPEQQQRFVPPLAEIGLKRFDAVSWFMLVAPSGTPREIVGKLHREVTTAIADPEVRREFVKLGLVPVQSPSPEELPGFVQSEIARWGAIVKKAGLAGSQ